MPSLAWFCRTASHIRFNICTQLLQHLYFDLFQFIPSSWHILIRYWIWETSFFESIPLWRQEETEKVVHVVHGSVANAIFRAVSSKGQILSPKLNIKMSKQLRILCLFRSFRRHLYRIERTTWQPTLAPSTERGGYHALKIFPIR